MGLRDSKRFSWHTDPDCCPSRGVRALAQMPMHILNLRDDGFAVNFYEDSQARFRLSSGLEIQTMIETGYPFSEDIKITVRPKEPSSFKVYLRLPGWCEGWHLDVNGSRLETSPDAAGYFVIDRFWMSEDQIELRLAMPIVVLVDELGNNGRVALARGPLVYAADNDYLPDGMMIDDVILLLNRTHPSEGIRVVPGLQADSIHLAVPIAMVNANKGSRGWKERERYYRLVDGDETCSFMDIRLVPFFEAGTTDLQSYKEGVSKNTEPVTRITYQVWLPYKFTG